MRYRIKNYTISGASDFTIKGKVNVEDLRLIINETQKKIICSSMNKSNVNCRYLEHVDSTNIFFDESICQLQPKDQLTIEVDQGDNIQDIVEQIDEDVAFQLKQILGYE